MIELTERVLIRNRLQKLISTNDGGTVAKWYVEDVKFLLEAENSLLKEILKERVRQEDLRERGKFSWTCADPVQSNARKLTVLAEEFGEVSRACMEEIIATDVSKDPAEHIANLRTELIQVAAVAVAWVEALDAKGK